MRDVFRPIVDLFNGRRRGAGPSFVQIPRGIRHDGLDLVLERLSEFGAGPGEDLDAVVLEWVVRCGDNHSGRVAHSRREVGNCRRRNDASADERAALRANARRQLAFDPGARFAGIAARQKPDGPGVVSHGTRQRRAEPPNRWTVERIQTRSAAHSISAEQSSHK